MVRGAVWNRRSELVSIPNRPVKHSRSNSAGNDHEDTVVQCAEACRVMGRLHDTRHTFITKLAESGAGDQTIMDIAGKVSPQMAKHYSHIRMQTKRDAVEKVWPTQKTAANKPALLKSLRESSRPQLEEPEHAEGKSSNPQSEDPSAEADE